MEALADRLSTGFRRPFFRRYRIASADGPAGRLVLVEPLAFMNRSGEVVARLAGSAMGANLLVVYDSMDLPPGSLRFRLRGSSGGHKGMASLIEALGTEEFPRLAIGIGRPASKDRTIEHVLSEPAGEERPLFLASIGRAADAILAYSRDGASKVMNELNRKETPAAPDG